MYNNPREYCCTEPLKNHATASAHTSFALHLLCHCSAKPPCMLSKLIIRYSATLQSSSHWSREKPAVRGWTETHLSSPQLKDSDTKVTEDLRSLYLHFNNYNTKLFTSHFTVSRLFSFSFFGDLWGKTSTFWWSQTDGVKSPSMKEKLNQWQLYVIVKCLTRYTNNEWSTVLNKCGSLTYFWGFCFLKIHFNENDLFVVLPCFCSIFLLKEDIYKENLN